MVAGMSESIRGRDFRGTFIFGTTGTGIIFRSWPWEDTNKRNPELKLIFRGEVAVKDLAVIALFSEMHLTLIQLCHALLHVVDL